MPIPHPIPATETLCTCTGCGRLVGRVEACRTCARRAAAAMVFVFAAAYALLVVLG